MNEHGYRWTRGFDGSGKAHYARPGAVEGNPAVCDDTRVGPDWEGPWDQPFGSLPPAPPERCGACVLQYLVETDQVRMVKRSAFTPIQEDLSVPGELRAR